MHSLNGFAVGDVWLVVYGAKEISFYKFISAALPILKAPDFGIFAWIA